MSPSRTPFQPDNKSDNPSNANAIPNHSNPLESETVIHPQQPAHSKETSPTAQQEIAATFERELDALSDIDELDEETYLQETESDSDESVLFDTDGAFPSDSPTFSVSEQVQEDSGTTSPLMYPQRRARASTQTNVPIIWDARPRQVHSTGKIRISNYLT